MSEAERGRGSPMGLGGGGVLDCSGGSRISRMGVWSDKHVQCKT